MGVYIIAVRFNSESGDGLTTQISGREGEIVSPNSPSFYPNSFNHTWIIEVNADSTIELEITYFNTEQNSDVLTVCASTG